MDKKNDTEKDDKPIRGVRKTGRGCTDVIFLILLIICWIGMTVVAYYAIQGGNLDRLKYGRDAENNLCGSTIGSDSQRDLVLQPNLYIFNPVNKNSYSKCVETCPTVTASSLDEVGDAIICVYDVEPSVDMVKRAQQVRDGICVLTLQSEPVVYRCVPKVLLQLSNNASNINGNINQSVSLMGETFTLKFNARSTASKIYQDVGKYSWVMMASVGIALGLNFFWLFILQYFAGLFVWLSILMVLCSSYVLAGFLIYNYYTVAIKHGEILVSSGSATVDTAVYNEKVLLTLAVIFGSIALISTLLICCLIRRIKLAIVVIKEAARATKAIPTLPLLIILKFIGLFAFMAWFSFIYAMLSTAGESIAGSTVSGVNNFTGEQFGKSINITGNQAAPYLQIFYVFGFFWTYNWIIAIGQTAIAGAIAIWYWTSPKSSFMPGAVIKSLSSVLFYHLGSLALGSLILAIVQWIRYILARMYAQQKKLSSSTVMKFVCCCLQCCLGCIEIIIKFINKNAYIMIAINGKNFCKSSGDAFVLLARNAIRLLVIDGITSFIIFMTKLSITCTTAIISIYLLTKDSGGEFDAERAMSNWSIPLVFSLIFAWIVSSGFFSILDMAVDTIFLCFCQDVEENDGSAEKPFFMSDKMKKFAT